MSARFSTLVARVPPLSKAMSAFCVGLAVYGFLLPGDSGRKLIASGLLIGLGFIAPTLLERQRDDDWLAAALFCGIPLVVLSVMGVESGLWLALIASAVGVATVLTGRAVWFMLLALCLIWIGIALLTTKPPYTRIILDILGRSTTIGLTAFWSRAALRFPPTMLKESEPPVITEPTLQRLTRACERLRATARRTDMLEEMVSAAKAIGPFEYASIATVSWREGTVHLEVVLGASGHTLGASEGLDLSWAELAPFVRDDARIGDRAFLADHLPFRAIPDERYLLLPLTMANGEINGLLVVGASEPNARERLGNAAPLLELLGIQGAAALETVGLQSRLAQRLDQAASDLNRTNEDARKARWQVESLYNIVRALSTTLDPQHLLDQALILISQATQAERGGIMLADARTGRLTFGTNMERHLTQSEAAVLERGQGLAGWVMEHRSIAIIPNTAEDERWLVRSEHDTSGRSALAVPLEHEDTAEGVIVLIHTSPGHFTADHAEFVQIIGNQVATMLNNARQHQVLHEQVGQMTALVDQREEEASRSLAILRSIGDGVVVGDRLGRIRLINPAAERLLNIEASRYLGQSLISLPGPVDNSEHTIDPTEFQEFEVGGHTIRAYTMPVVTTNNDWLGSVVVYHDVSSTQLADRLKTEFVATASHELRTPLTSIGGYIDLLLLNTLGPINDQQRQFLNVVKFNIERLTAILNDLLDMSRIEAGHIRLQRRPIAIDEIIHPLLLELHQQWNNKHVSLALDVPGDLPTIVADPDRVRQILYNLLSNAYKYTHERGRIDLIVRNGGGVVTISVRDTGVGIASRDHELIFTRFYRTDNPLKEQAGGTGLGLTITKSLVELHGGRIWFESEEGKGTTFIVELPVGGDAEWTPAAWLEGVD